MQVFPARSESRKMSRGCATTVVVDGFFFVVPYGLKGHRHLLGVWRRPLGFDALPPFLYAPRGFQCQRVKCQRTQEYDEYMLPPKICKYITVVIALLIVKNRRGVSKLFML